MSEASDGPQALETLAADPAIASILDRFYPRATRVESVALVPVAPPTRRVAFADARASLEPLIRTWIGVALDLGAQGIGIGMTPAGLRVTAEADGGEVTIAEPHASLYRELVRRLRQCAGMRAASVAARRESGVLPYVRNGERLRLGLTFIPDDFGCRVRLNLSEARGHLDDPARGRSRRDTEPTVAVRLAS